MRCPACSYLYFKQIDTCPKCGGALGDAKPSAQQITIDEKLNPPALAAAAVAVVPVEVAAPAEAVAAPVPAVADVPTAVEAVVEARVEAAPEPVSEPVAAELSSPVLAVTEQPPVESAPTMTAETVAAAVEPEKPKISRRERKRRAKAEQLAAQVAAVSETAPPVTAAETIPVDEQSVISAEKAFPEAAAIESAAAEPAAVETVKERPVPFDEQSFSRIERPAPSMQGIELRAPAPLSPEVASGQKNADIISTPKEPEYAAAAPVTKPRVRVMADKLETAPAVVPVAAAPAGSEKPAISPVSMESLGDISEVSFHPAPAPAAPKPIEAPKPPVLAAPEKPLPELKVPRIDLPKVELPRIRPVGGEPIVPKFAAETAARETADASKPVEVLPESAYEYEFDVSNPMIRPDEMMLDTRGAGRVIDPNEKTPEPVAELAVVPAEIPAVVTAEPSPNLGDDTFTRLVIQASSETPAMAMAVKAKTAEEMFDVTPSPTAETSMTDFASVAQNIDGNTDGNIDEISDNIAARVAGEPVAEAPVILADGPAPVRTLFPEILQADGDEQADADEYNLHDRYSDRRHDDGDGSGDQGRDDDSDNDAGDDMNDDGHGGGGHGDEEVSIPSAFDGFDPNIGALPAPEAAAMPAAAMVAATTQNTGNLSMPSWTPPERRIEQIFDEITDMSQKLDAPVIPNPDPIVPFNDGRFPGAMALDTAQGEMADAFGGATRISAHAIEDPDQISFPLGTSRPEMTPESQLQSADVLSASGIGIRLDTPVGMGLTGKLDDVRTAARMRTAGRDHSAGAWARNMKPRLTLPRQLVLKRALSYLIDTGMTFFAVILFVTAADKFTGAEFSLFHEPGAWLARTWWVLLILKTLVEGIFYVGLVSLVGQTPGDMIMKLKIVARDGADATPALVIRRYFWLWPFNLLFCWGGLPLLVGGAETAHDRRAGTRVVETV